MNAPGNDFAENLRSICAELGSIANVCREIGINRQQFNRYINGTGMPSAFNMRRIAKHFSLTEEDFFAPHEEFYRRFIKGQQRIKAGPVDLMTGAFRGQAGPLRRYLGFYHSHFLTPTWEGMILRSLVWLYEKDGFVKTRSIERVVAPDGSFVQKSRYEGLVAQRGNRIYVVEHEMVRDGSIVETILTPSHRQQVRLLNGLTMGVAWRPYLMPYASPSIWKRLGETVSAREALAACGAFSFNDTAIEPAIRSFFRKREEDGAHGLLANVLT